MQSVLESGYLAIRVVHSPNDLGCTLLFYDPLRVTVRLEIATGYEKRWLLLAKGLNEGLYRPRTVTKILEQQTSHMSDRTMYRPLIGCHKSDT